MKNNSVSNLNSHESYKILKDKKIIGTFILIVSLLMFIFSVPEVKLLSSIPRYSIGMFFGAFSPAVYAFFSWISIKMIFPEKLKLPKWLKINLLTYWIILLSAMLIAQAWGWASTRTNIVKPGLIGSEPWEVSFKDWFKTFSKNKTATWFPSEYECWGGIVGSFIWSITTTALTPIGSGILGIFALASSISLILTGSFIGLFKNIIAKRKLEIKADKSKKDNLNNFIADKGYAADIEDDLEIQEENKNLIMPFEDPFSDPEEAYKKIRSTEVFSIPKNESMDQLKEGINKNQDKLNELFKSFKINAFVYKTIVGSALTKYIIASGPGINFKKFIQLESNIKTSLNVPNIRIDLPLPSQSAIGIEVPNSNPQIVPFKSIYDELDKKYNKDVLSVVIGETVTGKPLILFLNKTPHLLIGGQDKSGKSIVIKNIIISLLMKDPENISLILIDSNMVDFIPYNNTPHLWVPVIKDSIKAAQALEAITYEMEKRFQKISNINVKNFEEYNLKNPTKKWPYIVVIINEMSDLMKDTKQMVEASIQRITQKSHIVGIHLIIATKKLSTNVITETIKNNLTSKICLSVPSAIESKIILDSEGAEKLSDNGDMLISLYGKGLKRCQAAIISNKEMQLVINKVENFIKPKRNNLFNNFKDEKEIEI
ncbi:MAG: hypothetical protein GY679_01060 [Mycoplasma sp.]|nr:hypothetical protein [Mycoplasma sp.]